MTLTQDQYLASLRLLVPGASYTVRAAGIIWHDDRPQPSAAEVEAAYIEVVRADKIAELREACRNHIFAGFASSALGAEHHYPAKQDGAHQDQLNLAGLVAKSHEEPQGTFKFWCADSQGVWERRAHTAEQIRAVGVDGANHVIAAQEKLADLTAQVYAATTSAAAGAIVW